MRERIVMSPVLQMRPEMRLRITPRLRRPGMELPAETPGSGTPERPWRERRQRPDDPPRREGVPRG